MLLRHRQTRIQRTGRQIVNPLVLSTVSIAEPAPNTNAQVKSQTYAQNVPSISMLRSTLSLSSYVTLANLTWAADTLSFLGYPQSTSALREKQRLVSDGYDSTAPIRSPDTPEASGATRSPDSARRSESTNLRREIEELRRNLEHRGPLCWNKNEGRLRNHHLYMIFDLKIIPDSNCSDILAFSSTEYLSQYL